MRQMKAELRQNFEDYLKFVERAVLCGAVGVAVGTLAHAPQVSGSPVLWLLAVMVAILGGVAAVIATAALYADTLGEKIKNEKAKAIAIFSSWCFLLAVLFVAFTFSSKIVDIQAKQVGSPSRDANAFGCTSVTDCAK